MVSFTLYTVKFLLIYIHLQNTYWFKRSQTDARFTFRRPSHCPICRNEQRWKPHADVWLCPTTLPLTRTWVVRIQYTQWDAFRCLASDISFEVAKFSERQNQSAQLTPFYIFVCLASTLSRFSAWATHCKCMKFFNQNYAKICRIT